MAYSLDIKPIFQHKSRIRIMTFNIRNSIPETHEHSSHRDKRYKETCEERTIPFALPVDFVLRECDVLMVNRNTNVQRNLTQILIGGPLKLFSMTSETVITIHKPIASRQYTVHHSLVHDYLNLTSYSLYWHKRHWLCSPRHAEENETPMIDCHNAALNHLREVFCRLLKVQPSKSMLILSRLLRSLQVTRVPV